LPKSPQVIQTLLHLLDRMSAIGRNVGLCRHTIRLDSRISISDLAPCEQNLSMSVRYWIKVSRQLLNRTNFRLQCDLLILHFCKLGTLSLAMNTRRKICYRRASLEIFRSLHSAQHLLGLPALHRKPESWIEHLEELSIVRPRLQDHRKKCKDGIM
jgi:hypothetical protein